jgi:hypothetical protein
MKMQPRSESQIRSQNLLAADRQKLLERELDRWLPLLIEHLKPEQILLFGSLTDKRLHEWSDIEEEYYMRDSDRWLAFAREDLRNERHKRHLMLQEK